MAEKIARKIPFHFAWIELVMCCFYFFATMGLYNTCGLFYPRICEDMGWTISYYSICTIIQGIASLAGITMAGRLYAVYPTKGILVVFSVMMGLTHMMKGMVSSLLGFCIQGALYGLSCGILLYVPVPMILNNWFREKRGTALGTALLCSGVGGALFSPMMTKIMDTLGWRAASYIGGVIPLVIAVPLLLLFCVKKPADIGMKAYGEDFPPEMLDPKKNKNHPNFYHYPPETARRNVILCFILAILILLVAGITQQIPNYAAVHGISTTIGAALFSANMIGNMFSKGVLGMICDRFGERIAYCGCMIFVGFGLLIMAFCSSIVTLLYVGSFFIGFGGAANTMTVPSVLATFTKGEEYQKLVSRSSMGTGIANIFGTAFLAALFDFFGSYTPVMLILLTFLAACIAIVIITCPAGKSTEAD